MTSSTMSASALMVRHALEQLGPFYIKVGQGASDLGPTSSRTR